jgi:hypothetical protein
MSLDIYGDKVKSFFELEEIKSEARDEAESLKHIQNQGATYTFVDGAVWAMNKINALIESMPVLYKYKGSKYADWSRDIDEDFGGIKKYSHKARLAFVEEIAKEPCLHPRSHLVTFPNDPHKAQCGICQIELQATWSEKK